MKLNEVFTPLFESSDVYQSLRPHEIENYKDIIADYARRKEYIYRGMLGNEAVYLGLGKRINRTSANTHSFVSTIVDELMPEWDKFPDRLKSFICTTNKPDAEAYGNIFYVIPLDNQDIGVCPERDFWFSFEHQYKHTIEDINRLIFLIFAYAQNLNLIPDSLKLTSKMHLPASTLKNYIDIIDKNNLVVKYKEFIEKESNFYYRTVFEPLMKDETNLWKFLTSYLQPDYFQVTKYPNIPAGHLELWMSGNVLFVEQDYFDSNIGLR